MMAEPRRRLAEGAHMLLTALGFLLSAVVYYPGLFTPDSLEQFNQARSGAFADWHPPAMAALWRLLDQIHVGPELLFLLHLALFWGGVWAMASALRRLGRWWGALFPLIGLLPFVFNYLGLLWKDVALAAAWTFACGIYFRRRAHGEALRAIDHALIWPALLYGALVRANSIFAAAPLALYLLGGDVLSRRLWPQALACVVTPLALITATALCNGVVLHAEREHPEDSLFLFDLVGVSHNLGQSVVPGPWSAAQAARIPSCYGPDKWDHVGMGACTFVTQTLDDRGLWGTPLVYHAWLGALARYPGAYLAHRLGYANQMLRWLGPIPAEDVFLESEMTDARYAHHPGAVFRGYEALCNALQSTPLFRPYFWLLVSAIVLAASWFAQDSLQRRFAAALSASAFIYLVTYIPFGVASDFRYAYWSVIAAIAALAALFACEWRQRRAATIALCLSLTVVGAAVAMSAAS
jgi:hypothetical protein